MKIKSCKMFLVALVSIFMFACGDNPTSTTDIPDIPDIPDTPDTPDTPTAASILGNPDYQAISYGAWRTTTREAGTNVPTVEQQKEDMKILAAMGIKVLRTYNTQGYIGDDGKSNTENLLIAIDELMQEDPNFEMYVMLGVWIDALNSWTDLEVIHDQENPGNAAEMAMGIQLAKDYPEIVKVIAVGNEAMVHWAPYHVAPAIILNHVNTLQALKASGEINEDIWITSSDNHASWSGLGEYESDDLAALVEAVDYISVHTYPFHDTHYNNAFWLMPEEEADLSVKERVDAAMVRAKELAVLQFDSAVDYMQGLGIDKPVHVGETGWASETNVNYGDEGSKAADEYKQKAFYDAIRSWGDENEVSVFFFQAFDEAWKGSADNAGDSEKHFGLIDIDCNVKYVAWDKVDTLNELGLTRDCNAGFTKSFNGVEQDVIDTADAPKPAPVYTGELLSDGDFASNSGASWSETDSDGGSWGGTGGDATYDYSSGAAVATIVQGDSTVNFEIQLHQQINFEAATYTVSFDYSASEEAEIGFTIENPSDYTVYLAEDSDDSKAHLTATTTVNNYTHEFTLENESSLKLAFLLSTAPTGSTVTIDNVVLEKQ